MKSFIRTGEIEITTPDDESIVLKFSGFTSWSKGRYDFQLRMYDRLMIERFGADYRLLEDKDPDVATMMAQAWRWAYLCSCATDMPVEWREITLPEYIDQIPPMLSDQIGMLAIELNPEIFSRGIESEKNAGFFNVKRSMN